MLVEIWSDIACPWCYIGKRRFEKALKNLDQSDQVQVTVQWRSFELNLESTKGRSEPVIDAFCKHKGVTVARAGELFANVTKIAAEEGLKFNFDIAQSGSTFDAHRLIHFAESSPQKLGDVMKERLLSAFFERGESTADISKLVDIASEIGLDARETRKMLESDKFSDDVRRDEERGRKIGVNGVPFFLIDGKYRISGAESPDVILKVLRKATAGEIETNPVSKVVGVCDDSGCSK